MKLYHLSFNENLDEVLYPRLPDRDHYNIPVPGKDYFDEDLPPRISFAPTVQGCFHGIFPNIMEVYNEAMSKHNGVFHIWLYEGLPDEHTKYIPTSEVRKRVWDSYVTGEICVASEIRVKRVGQLKVTIIGNGSYGFDVKAVDPTGRERSIGPLIRYELL